MRDGIDVGMSRTAKASVVGVCYHGSNSIGKYGSDGLTRRIKSHIDSQAPASPNGVDAYRHFYYNSGWQTLETRKSTSENTEPEGV